MKIRVFLGMVRILILSVASLFVACSSPTSGSGGGDDSAITGTAQFRANNGAVTHHVLMAAFFSHDGSATVSSNIIDLGTTALQPKAFSLTPIFPADAVVGDFMVFSAWLDVDDDGAFDFDDEQRQPMPTEALDDKVFLVGDSLLLFKADGWHFEDSEGGVGDLYSAHNRVGTKLISVSMN